MAGQRADPPARDAGGHPGLPATDHDDRVIGLVQRLAVLGAEAEFEIRLDPAERLEGELDHLRGVLAGLAEELGALFGRHPGPSALL